ncbi:hypothetical protein AYI68_g3156 [Smittium mucronatum]|uniref:Uncharacterized protein n=1 Tax=Smittium mucronatum TaxID=133383 RepID=A0A1R0H0R1_9FUNG|nr:hypothetical protein AYI68_g3156 [Smittium mucronatum]
MTDFRFDDESFPTSPKYLEYASNNHSFNYLLNKNNDKDFENSFINPPKNNIPKHPLIKNNSNSRLPNLSISTNPIRNFQRHPYKYGYGISQDTEALYISASKNRDLILKEQLDSLSRPSTTRTSLSADTKSNWGFLYEGNSEVSESDSVSSRFTDYSNHIIKGAQKSFRTSNQASLHSFNKSSNFDSSNKHFEPNLFDQLYFPILTLFSNIFFISLLYNIIDIINLGEIHSSENINETPVTSNETLLNNNYDYGKFDSYINSNYLQEWTSAEPFPLKTDESYFSFRKLKNKSSKKKHKHKNSIPKISRNISDSDSNFSIGTSDSRSIISSREPSLIYDSEELLYFDSSSTSDEISPYAYHHSFNNSKESNSSKLYNNHPNFDSASYPPVNPNIIRYLDNYDYSHNDPKCLNSIGSSEKPPNIQSETLNVQNRGFLNTLEIDSNDLDGNITSNILSSQLKYQDKYSDKLAPSIVKKDNVSSLSFPTKGPLYYIFFFTTSGLSALQPIVSSLCVRELM